MKFLKSTFLTLGTNIVIFSISILTTLLTARLLGTAGKGVMSVGNNVISFGILIFGVGVEAASIYYIGKNNENLNSALGINAALSAFSILALSAVYALNLRFDFKIFQGLDSYILPVVFLAVAAGLLRSGMLNSLLALQDFGRYNKINLLDKVLTFIFLLVAILLFKSAEAALASYFFSIVVISAILIWVLRIRYKARPKIKNNLYLSFFKFGIKGQLGNIISMLNYRADIFLITYFQDLRAVGIYSVAVALGETMWQIPGSISTVIYPMTTNSKDKLGMKFFISKVTRITLFIVTVGGIILVLISEPIIVFLMGPDFRESSTALIWLIPGICIFSVSKVLANYISGLGHIEKNIIASSTATVINIILNISFIPRMGIVGAAFATSISYTAFTVIALYYYMKYTDIPLRDVLLIKREDFLEVMSAVKGKLSAIGRK
ncbi:oligosaccharide flippase family protein [Clostridium thermarum]|uniref:oligosaccharide flippase family protein n=1 Tax=Clostridium thermarum TaxID=1716543 RepID=UPI001122DFA0|nr:oligosaccharide flippase family protein [Clostridium thermarum]